MKPLIAIPAIIALVHRAWSRKSLTPLGLLAATVTAIIHALHPWSTPFALLCVFYLAGTKATKVKHEIKSSLTLSATGSEGGDTQRTHSQVLANSIVATVLVMLHTYTLRYKHGGGHTEDGPCFSFGAHAADILAVGIVANYVSVAADTFSSELGILSKTPPRLITSLRLRIVPRGTNGGVTTAGLVAGVCGAFLLAVTSGLLLPGCSGDGGFQRRILWVVAMTIWGALGSVLDSVLGGSVQASVVDKRSGKVVEGSGGKKVLVHPSSTKPTATDTANAPTLEDSAQLRNTEAVANTVTLRGSRVTGTSEGTQPGRPHDESHESRRVETGWDFLDNNAINVLMAAIMSLGAMVIAGWMWDLSIWEVMA